MKLYPKDKPLDKRKFIRELRNDNDLLDIQKEIIRKHINSVVNQSPINADSIIFDDNIDTKSQ
mgnify:CR=1 FL=1